MKKFFRNGSIVLVGKYHEEALYDVSSNGLCVTFDGRGGIADYAVKTGSAALMLLLTLMIGGDLRRIAQKKAPVQPAPAMGDTQVIPRT